MERLLTAEDVRVMLNLKSVRTVYRHAQAGRIPCYRVGAAIRFKQDEILMALKGGQHAKKRDTERRSDPAR